MSIFYCHTSQYVIIYAFYIHLQYVIYFYMGQTYSQFSYGIHIYIYIYCLPHVYKYFMCGIHVCTYIAFANEKSDFFESKTRDPLFC